MGKAAPLPTSINGLASNDIPPFTAKQLRAAAIQFAIRVSPLITTDTPDVSVRRTTLSWQSSRHPLGASANACAVVVLPAPLTPMKTTTVSSGFATADACTTEVPKRATNLAVTALR